MAQKLSGDTLSANERDQLRQLAATHTNPDAGESAPGLVAHEHRKCARGLRPGPRRRRRPLRQLRQLRDSQCPEQSRKPSRASPPTWTPNSASSRIRCSDLPRVPLCLSRCYPESSTHAFCFHSRSHRGLSRRPHARHRRRRGSRERRRLTIAAEIVTPEIINFMARHARGLICLSLSPDICDALHLPPMSSRNTSRFGTAFCESIEAAEGVTTGISAADRAHTIRVAINPASKPGDLARPGHVFPLARPRRRRAGARRTNRSRRRSRAPRRICAPAA